ncbi:MAG: hypothetical protein ACNS62_02455 [Candidatus Cyclobacteriaceae bacterium M3_2C_046]
MIKEIHKKALQLDQVHIDYHEIDYDSSGTSISRNETEMVRLHFGLAGRYSFYYDQLKSSFQLSGHHHNLLYTKGLVW